MTFAQRIKELLVDNGMSDNQADDVIHIMETSKTYKKLHKRLSDNVEGCPPHMKTIMWVIAKEIALQYIEENCPEANFKSKFQ